jgi:hypothetical protein
VVVPADPRPCLVLRHPEVALAVLEELLHLMPRARHQRHHSQGRLHVAVADVVLDLGLLLQRAADQHPDRRPRLAVADRPGPRRRELEDQRPDRPLAHLEPLPGAGGQARRQRGHRTHRLAARATRRLAPPRVRRHARRRVRRPDRGRRGDLHHVPLAQLLQLVEQVPIGAVRLVGGDPIQADVPQHGDVADQRCRDLWLGPERQILGDMGLGTAPSRLVPLIPGPVEIQSVIEQGGARGRHPDQEDADLAVVLLAEAAVVLPRHPGALGPLLGEGRLVDHADGADRGARRRGDELIGEGGLDLGLDVVIWPGGDGDELLEPGDLPGAGAEGDRLDALALGAAHQALDVGVGVVLGLLLAEERGEALVELDQLLGRGAHIVRSHGGGLLTKGLTNDESADARMTGSLPVYSTKRSRFSLRL